MGHQQEDRAIIRSWLDKLKDALADAEFTVALETKLTDLEVEKARIEALEWEFRSEAIRAAYRLGLDDESFSGRLVLFTNIPSQFKHLKQYIGHQGAPVTAVLRDMRTSFNVLNVSLMGVERYGDEESDARRPGDKERDSHHRREQGVFRKEGDFWLIHLDGEEVKKLLLRGLEIMHELVIRKGQRVSALELMMCFQPNSVAPRVSVRHGNLAEEQDSDKKNELSGGFVGEAEDVLDETLDPTAKEQYHERLRELAQERAEAERNSDTAWEARIDQESSDIRAALQEAEPPRRYGPRRDHRTPRERARKNVEKAISRALKSLEPQAPGIAQHFREAISTGHECVYDPPQPITWSL